MKPWLNLFNVAELCRDHFPRPIVWIMWVVSEIAAMATDLAEFLGGAIGLSLLFGMPLMMGMVVTAIITYGILMFEGRGFRPMELVIGTMVGVIGLCYLVSCSWRRYSVFRSGFAIGRCFALDATNVAYCFSPQDRNLMAVLADGSTYWRYPLPGNNVDNHTDTTLHAS